MSIIEIKVTYYTYLWELIDLAEEIKLGFLTD